jgi:S-DNA-T family DNA segregation ATPase FtsK/SpoIIIE
MPQSRHPEPRRVSLPRPADAPPRHPFPLLASIAPVVGSIVIWAITSSPFALVFAGLGPVVAIATMADSRWQGRRTLRRERARFAEELGDAARLIDAAHADEAAERAARTAPALALLSAPLHDPERWRASLSEELPVSLGVGRVRSDLRVDGGGTPELDALVAAAETVRAPIVVDARLGIGIVGPTVWARAIARGLALQIAARLAPESATCAGESAEVEWLGELPHRSTTGGPDTFSWSEGDARVLIAHALDAAGLPHECRVVLVAGHGGESRVASHPDPALCVVVESERVSLAQAVEIAARLSLAAGGRASAAGSLPDTLAWSELRHPATGALGATFLVGPDGPLSVDLVAHGPHAVVAGTTGSGKSELLVSWLLAIAATRGPHEVAFLLVDFKGGASFGPVANLPHVVGLVTDLDERTAHRALVSLRAEVLLRERTLAAAGARSIDELDPDDSKPDVRMPRLVIVVDEFAALVSGFDELHALFADLAARGRSLGVHLVLSTQRPAGVVRDSVLANVPLRVSLRVHNRADSVALLGTDAAALLPARPAGRAVLVLPGGDQVTTQIALAETRDVTGVTARWSSSAAPRRPWCDDLPDSLRIDALPLGAFGLLDLPSEQRQVPAIWDPRTEGNLLVLGMSRSGKTTALSAIAHAGGAEPVTGGIEVAWDRVSGAVEGVRAGTGSRVTLLFDDLDALLPRFGDDYQQAFVELLVELLRTGGAAGVHVAATARRLTAPLQQLAQLCDARLILRQQNRQEHLLLGADPALFAGSAPPGRGEWRGVSVQVALAPAPTAPRRDRGPEFDPAAWPSTLVVTSRPEEFVARWGAAELGALEIREASAPSVIVADADSWHANWARLAGLRRSSAMLFDGCTIADFRALSGTRRLPPPIERPGTRGWLLEPGGALRRVGLGTG